MTLDEKCKLVIQKGYTYNPETGFVYGKKNNVITNIDNGYVRFQLHINNKKYNIRVHQFAWYYMYNECVKEIDHINGNRSDNKINNLRSVTRNQNMWNRKTAKGYHWNKKAQKYAAQIRINNKAIHLGLYNTEEEASQAYLKAKEIYHKI
jgi:hypothetical protein